MRLYFAINILMIKNCMLPSKPQEREELIRKIKQQINRITSQNNMSTGQVLQIKTILEQRIKLINNCKQYSENRISNLQLIFKHYSTHLFRSGQKYDFDQIGYLNDHLIMERFFAFVNDFKINQINFNGELNQLAERKDIILIFKKSSSNARNLDLPQFIACLERLFVFLFNQNQGYKAKQQKLQAQKKQRLAEFKKRQKLQKQKNKAKNPRNQKSAPSPPKKAQNPQAKQLRTSVSKKQNDEMMKNMMKDFEIVNPTNEVKQTVESINKSNLNDQLYQITDSQKIQSYMQRIGIDDRKQIEKKLRYFEKANYKYFQVEQLNRYRDKQPIKRDQEKGNQPLNLKSQLTQMHDEWRKDKVVQEKSKAQRFLNVMENLNKRQIAKSQDHMIRSLSREKYENKRKRMDEKFMSRQFDLMYPTAKQRVTKKKAQQSNSVYFSLQMLHRSTPNQLPINKIYPDRYISADPTDHIYMDEYGFVRNGGKDMSYISHRGKSEIIESTKRRAVQLQNQETKRMSRLAVNLVQNHHYLQKFLQRKW